MYNERNIVNNLIHNYVCVLNIPITTFNQKVVKLVQYKFEFKFFFVNCQLFCVQNICRFENPYYNFHPQYLDISLYVQRK